MTDKPMHLYKYLSPDRLPVLQNGLIRFTQPGDFNDPFELRAPLMRVMSRKEMYDSMRKEAKKEILQRLRASSPQTKIRDTQINLLVERALAANSAELDRRLTQGQEAFCDYMNSEAMPFAANKTLGLLCLTKTPTSTLMWGHYTNSYAGFVLEFDINHSFFSCPSDIHEDVGRLHEVKYCQRRPEFNLDTPSLDFLFSKANEWQYEQEWRLIRPLKTADVTVPRKPFDIHLFRIPPEAITAVIVGHRMVEDNFDLLASHLQADSHKHIELKRIELHETEFALSVKPLRTWHDLDADGLRASRGKQFINELNA